MKIKTYFKEVLAQIRMLDKKQKSNLFFVTMTLFWTLFSYPIIRSTTDAFFLDSFGAKKSPHVWMYSVIALALAVWLYNQWQKKLSVHRLYLYTSIFSFLFIGFCLLILLMGNKSWAYPLFIWKEVYIVLLIHMAMGYLNTSVEVKTAKILYGPVGSICALAGILGGLLTAQLTYFLPIEWILVIGSTIILVSALSFWQTHDHPTASLPEHDLLTEKTPLSSLLNVKKYVLFIVIIVALSQFCINLANFNFNVLFDQLVPDITLKARYLGTVYSSINALSFCVQIFIVPIIFQIFRTRSIHLFLPSFFLLVSIGGFFIGGGLLLPVTASFVIFKGLDYSLFNTAREILYFPLKKTQRYGAKYLADIVSYRLAKGIISFILILIQTTMAINFLLTSSLILWFIILIFLFRERKRIILLKEDIDEQPSTKTI